MTPANQERSFANSKGHIHRVDMLEEILRVALFPSRLAGAVVGVVLAVGYLWLFPDAPEEVAAALFAIPFAVGVIIRAKRWRKRSE